MKMAHCTPTPGVDLPGVSIRVNTYKFLAYETLHHFLEKDYEGAEKFAQMLDTVWGDTLGCTEKLTGTNDTDMGTVDHLMDTFIASISSRGHRAEDADPEKVMATYKAYQSALDKVAGN